MTVGKSKKSAGADRGTAACFFLIAVSYKLAWTAISSLLSQFSRDYGPQVLLQLNVAYFLPSIPVLILQTKFNETLDRRLGSPARGSLLRFAIGLGSLAMLTSYFPALATSHTRLLAVTTAVGMAYGVAFGTSYQLASQFAPINTVMLTTGFVSSGPIVLAFDLAIKRGPFYSPAGLRYLFLAVSWVTLGGLGAACVLVFINRVALQLSVEPHRVEVSGRGGRGAGGAKVGRGKGSQGPFSGPAMRFRSELGSDGGSEGGNHHHHTVMLDVMEGGGDMGLSTQASYPPGGSSSGYEASLHPTARRQNSLGDHTGSFSGVSNGNGAGSYGGYAGNGAYDSSTGKQRKPDLPMYSVALRISPAALAIFLSVGTSMLVFPFFTYMHSTGLLGDRLAQVLFYVRLVGDIAGRLVPRRLQANTVAGLMAWALIKTAMVPVLFGCIFSPQWLGGDMGAVVVVAVFWVLSGYVNTCSYLVAPTLVPPAAKARASGLMTVAFQSSCFLALLGAAAVQRLGAQHVVAA